MKDLYQTNSELVLHPRNKLFLNASEIETFHEKCWFDYAIEHTHTHTRTHTHMHTHTHVHRVLKLPLRTSTWFTQVPWRYFQALIISWLCFFTFPWFSDIILAIAASSSLNFVRAMSSMVSTCILAPRRTICGSCNWPSAIFKTLTYLNGVQRLPFFITCSIYCLVLNDNVMCNITLQGSYGLVSCLVGCLSNALKHLIKIPLL